MEDNAPVTRVAMPIARFFALACGWWLLGFSILTCVDIVCRKLFGITLQGTDEIGGYSMAIVSAFGFTYTLLNRSHTRIDILLGIVTPRLRSVLSVLSALGLAAMAVYGALRGWSVLQESLEFRAVSNSPLQIPMWIPQGLWLAGLVLFAGVATAMAVHAVKLLFTDYQRVNVYYGPPTIDEEIKASMADSSAGAREQS
jgi:TRAP-type C4-dicarboxylate transport system permease small subunit